MKKFHLPLPEKTYTLLRAHAEHTHVPATILAREAIESWLKDQARRERHNTIAAYAADVLVQVSTWTEVDALSTTYCWIGIVVPVCVWTPPIVITTSASPFGSDGGTRTLN